MKKTYQFGNKSSVAKLGIVKLTTKGLESILTIHSMEFISFFVPNGKSKVKG